jgi:hydrogenase maturation protease
MHTMILCLGNERMPGDGIAARVGRILKILPLPLSMSVRVANALDWECVDTIVDCDQLIVVDAMSSGHEPGTCFVEEVSPEYSPTFSLYCRHRQVVKDIVDLTQLLAQEGAAKRLVFIGVEVGGTREDDRGDSSGLVSSVPLVVDSVLRSFGAEVALRRMVGKTQAQIEAESDGAGVRDARLRGAA